LAEEVGISYIVIKSCHPACFLSLDWGRNSYDEGMEKEVHVKNNAETNKRSLKISNKDTKWVLVSCICNRT
jgi:hypothetical protein